MADKKISQLPLSAGINPVDISVLVDADTTEQYSFQQLLAFLALNFQSGAVFTFGTGAIPANTSGNNGDVYVKTNTGQFAQKLSGVWTVVYTIVQGIVGSTIFYGTVAPTTQGINGDTYLLTTNGTFYTKISGTWTAQFSMATGPVGPAGANGANGTAGTNGNTILYGSTNPSNSLGINGNFYLNDSNYTFFGPKASGAWPSGVSLIGPPAPETDPTRQNYATGTVLPIVLSNFQTYFPQYGSNPKFSIRKISGGAAVTASIVTGTTTASNGTYTAQAIVNRFGEYSGTGIGAGGTATFVVAGGVVTSVVIVSGGGLYNVNDTFTCADLPGAVFAIASVAEIFYADLTSQASIIIGENTDLFPDSISINVDDDGTGITADPLQIIISI